MPKVSIIVPVYNVEPYLRQCLDSILAQTFTDWECILVDDGSKDGSGAICDEYAEKDSRFRVVHQENKGSSAARNEGLSLSKGIYLSFIDSDDWVENNYLERLLEIAEFNNSDMVICAFYRNYLNRHTSVEPNKPTENKGIRVVVESLEGTLHAGLWNKLIKRSLFSDNNILFPKYNYYEDMNVTIRLANSTDSVSYCSDVLYNYRINQSSQTYHNNVSKKFSQFEEFAWNMNDLLSNVDFSEREVVVSAIYQRVNSYKYGMLTCYFCYRRELKHMLMILPESVNWERSLSRKALLILASRYGVFSPFMAVRTKVLVQNTIMRILRLIKRIIFK